MRRLFVVLALLALMVGVKTLQAESSEGATDPLTLATIGFVLLAAFTIAESGAALRLPRVTGYILGGALLGPSVGNLLDEDVVREMRMFNTLALGLIALSAGLELDVRQIAKVWRTLIATIVFKVVFLGILVGGGLVLFEQRFPSLGLASVQHVYALAFVFAALAIGTSPSITLALLSELRAKGRPADILLGAAVLKDLVVVAALALAVAAARPLLGAQAAGGPGGLGAVAVELGGSMLAGLILGGLLVAYIRFVHAEMLLFVAAMILVVAELTQALHLELLLVFIAAGFAVRNFSKYEHALMGPVSLVALPVFVVFFTNAGASIDIERTQRLLPIALALCVLRAIGMWGAARLGARIGGEAAPIRRHVWLGYLPQAGVTLGLVAIAAQQLPVLSDAIAGLGMAVVAVNLLVGPLTLRSALVKMGAVSGATATPSPASGGRAAVSGAESVGTEPDDGPAPLVRALGSTALEGAVHTLWRDLRDVGANYRLALLRESTKRVAGPLARALSEGSSPRDPAAVQDQVAGIAWLRVEEIGELAAAAFRRNRDHLRALPSEVWEPLAPSRLRPARGASLWVELGCWSRRLAMLVSRRARARRVPLQLAARVALERGVAHWASRQPVAHVRLRASVIEILKRHSRGQISSSDANQEVQRLLEGWPEQAGEDLEAVLCSGVRALVTTCLGADLPGADARRVRLSIHDASIAEHVAALEREPALWQRILDDLDTELRVEFQLDRASATFSESVSEVASRPADAALNRIDQVLAGVARELKRLMSELTIGEPAAPSIAADWRHHMDREQLVHLEEEEAVRLHPASLLQRLGLELRGVVRRLPERVEVLWAQVELGRLTEPASVGFRTVAPRAIAGEQLVEGLLPRFEEHLESLAAGMDTALETLQGIDAIVSQAIGQRDVAALGRARQQAEDARLELATLLPRFTSSAQTSIQQAFAATAARLSHQVASSVPQQGTTALSRVALAFTAQRRRSWSGLQRWMLGIASTFHRVGDFELAQIFRERLARGSLDGATIASRVRAFRHPPQVPAPYAKLFTGQPVREPRLFFSRRPELGAVLDAESRALDGLPTSTLIIGAHGSGRTSLINVCQLELRASRVLRAHPGAAQRRGQLLPALALELNCRPDAPSLTAALTQAQTTILVDDLEHWFEPNLAGAERLDEFVRLVSATRATTCFVVSLSSGAFQIFRELAPLQTAFARHVRLGPLGTDDLRELIEARHRLSGMPLEFHSELGLRWLRRLGSDRQAALFFRLLRRMTSGNVALALRVFLASADVSDGRVRIRTEHPLSVGLTFLDQLEPQQLAALNQALRFGGVNERTLEGTAEPRSDALVHLAFLQAAGLLVAEGPQRRLLSIPAELRPIIEQALVHRGAGHGGSA